MLGHCYDEVDHISLHAYYGLLDADGRPDLASFLASGADMDSFIQGVIATADYVRAKRRASKRMMLSFDEWNVWHTGTFEGGAWERAPRLSEDEFGAADAVVAGGLLISLLKHADRVTAACQAQLVNLLGVIRTEAGGPAWRQTIFYPFAQAAAYASGEALRLSITSPRHETARYGDVPVIDAVATRDEDAGTLTLFAVNRHPIEETDLTVDLRGFAGTVPASTWCSQRPIPRPPTRSTIPTGLLHTPAGWPRRRPTGHTFAGRFVECDPAGRPWHAGVVARSGGIAPPMTNVQNIDVSTTALTAVNRRAQCSSESSRSAT